VDELFEALTLIQTGKIEHFPIVMMGTSYRDEMIGFINKMARAGTISPEDVKLIYATDSVEEAIAPGSDSRHRRRADSARTGLQASHAFSPERRAHSSADVGIAGSHLSPFRFCCGLDRNNRISPDAKKQAKADQPPNFVPEFHS